MTASAYGTVGVLFRFFVLGLVSFGELVVDVGEVLLGLELVLIEVVGIDLGFDLFYFFSLGIQAVFVGVDLLVVISHLVSSSKPRRGRRSYVGSLPSTSRDRP